MTRQPKKMSSRLSEKIVEKLKKEITEPRFEGMRFKDAMKFLLSDGVFAETGLPLAPFFELEAWIDAQQNTETAYTATELKNKSGEILERILRGERVQITKHGRVLATILPTSRTQSVDS